MRMQAYATISLPVRVLRVRRMFAYTLPFTLLCMARMGYARGSEYLILTKMCYYYCVPYQLLAVGYAD